MSFQIRRELSDGDNPPVDQTFDPGITNISYNADDDSLILNVNFSSSDNLDGNYEITILDTVTNLAGNKLDGDGDGSAGGNFVTRFSIDTTAPTGNAPRQTDVVGEDASGTLYQFSGTVNDDFPGTDGEPIVVDLDVDGDGFDDGTVTVTNTTGSYTLDALTGIPSGSENHPVRVRFTDVRGNTSSPVEFTINTNVPVVSRAEVAGNTINITFNRSGLFNAGKMESYKVSERPLQSVTYNDATRTATLTLVGGIPDGTYTVLVFSGAEGITDGVLELDGNGDGIPGGGFITSLVVDSTAPTVEQILVDPSDNSPVTENDLNTFRALPTFVIRAADTFPNTSTGSLTVHLDTNGDGVFDDGSVTRLLTGPQTVTI